MRGDLSLRRSLALDLIRIESPEKVLRVRRLSRESCLREVEARVLALEALQHDLLGLLLLLDRGESGVTDQHTRPGLGQDGFLEVEMKLTVLCTSEQTSRPES